MSKKRKFTKVGKVWMWWMRMHKKNKPIMITAIDTENFKSKK